MKRLSKPEIRVGIFLIVGIALFTGFVFSVGEQSRIFEPKYRLWAYFARVSGLVAGAPVMLEGVDVGSVEDIELLLDPIGSRIRVTLLIERRVQDKIRADSKARIETMGLLGDKYIEITMGSFDKPVVEDGSILKSVEPVDYNAVLKRGQSVLKQLDEGSESLAQILKKIDEGKGLAGAIVNEEIDVKGAMDNFKSATQKLNAVLDEIKTGKGTLGMLLYDRNTRDNLAGVISSLDRIIAGIQGGTGTLGKLVKDDALYERLAVDIGDSARSLNSLLATLQSGEGLLPKLISKEGSAKMVEDLTGAIRSLNEASATLNSVAHKIDSGQGTLGKLINDPLIYDDLRDLLKGAKKSWFIRHLIKKGKKESEKRKKQAGKEEPEE
ncbi:MAG TPA: MlaD family protein [bacterium]|nr:MlaD family protein [bacterium]